MALNINNEEAHRLAVELSRITGETLTQAVIQSLRERLIRVQGKAGSSDLAEELMEIGRRCAARPVLDPRSPDEILGYDTKTDPGAL